MHASLQVRDLVTRLELDLAHTCSPILEQEEEELGSTAFRSTPLLYSFGKYLNTCNSMGTRRGRPR